MPLSSLPLRDVIIDDPFWSGRIDTARQVSLPYMWRVLHDEIPDAPPSRCIRNLRIAAGLEQGEFEGYRFQDSDLYKWLEAAAYSLETSPAPALQAQAEEAIALIEQAQRPDGYLDTYITLNGLEPWTDTCRAHELYCAGHLMEAAVAYHTATGDGRLLAAARRFADCIDGVFGPEPGKKKGYPGHQEVELALFKLFRKTGEERYLRLARFFLDRRGRQPFYYDEEQRERVARGEAPIEYYRDHGPQTYSYQQAHQPVREQTEAVGHAVRCLYMCAGMADVGAEADPSLLEAARTLYNNIVDTQMYLTGGVGSMGDGEAFTFPYDLPNDRMYNETCASIALVMASQRLLHAAPSARYADVMERALYNNILAGLSLDGTRFFYVNPMELWPERSLRRHDMRDIAPQRQSWYGCACCPPNVLRTLLGLGQYIYAFDPEKRCLHVNLYIGSTARFALDGTPVRVIQQGDLLGDGRIVFTVDAKAPVELELRLRAPGWCSDMTLALNGKQIELQPLLTDGFIALRRVFTGGDVVELTLAMAAGFVYCDDRVPYNAGKVALMRGPLVYCAEEADNGSHLWNLAVDPSAGVTEMTPPVLAGDVVSLQAEGQRRRLSTTQLYTAEPPAQERVPVVFVPYYAWGNRTAGEMSVWMRTVCPPPPPSFPSCLDSQ